MIVSIVRTDPAEPLIVPPCTSIAPPLVFIPPLLVFILPPPVSIVPPLVLRPPPPVISRSVPSNCKLDSPFNNPAVPVPVIT